MIRYIAIFLTPLFSMAQSGQYVNFNEGMSLREIIAEAKIKQMPIFIDCYATWCTPCKEMERTVFRDTSVAQYLNSNFLSVRVQMDTSTMDGAQQKLWYEDANSLQRKYKIKSLPSYIFLSPEGTPLHKDVGKKNVKQFVEVIKSALQPESQFFSKLKALQNNQLSMSKIHDLFLEAKEISLEDTLLNTAKLFSQNYLERLSEDELLSKESLNFYADFYKMLDSKDKIFMYFLKNSKRIDFTMQEDGFSRKYVKYVISKEDITPFLNGTKSKPDWKNIGGRIEGKYPTVSADEVIIPAKVFYYNKISDWPNYTKSLIKSVDNSIKERMPVGDMGAYFLNNSAYEILQYSNDNREIARAIRWMQIAEKILEDQGLLSALLDTRANLLYRINRVKEAIDTEEKALALAPDNQEIKSALKKMRAAEKITFESSK